MLETLQVVQTDARMTAVIHLTVARAEIAKVMGPARAEVATVLTAQGAAPEHWRTELNLLLAP